MTYEETVIFIGTGQNSRLTLPVQQESTDGGGVCESEVMLGIK